jgi:hypothetical protein
MSSFLSNACRIVPRCHRRRSVPCSGRIGTAAREDAVALVLLDRILDGLLREAVFQLESGDWQAIDKKPEVKRIRRLIETVAELPRDGEAVSRVSLLRFGIPRRRRTEEQFNGVRAVLHAVAQHVDDPTFSDFALQAREELLSCRSVSLEIETFEEIWLRRFNEGRQLYQVDGVAAVIVIRLSTIPAAVGRHMADD